jgi:hypothetical protein
MLNKAMILQIPQNVTDVLNGPATFSCPNKYLKRKQSDFNAGFTNPGLEGRRGD